MLSDAIPDYGIYLLGGAVFVIVTLFMLMKDSTFRNKLLHLQCHNKEIDDQKKDEYAKLSDFQPILQFI